MTRAIGLMGLCLAITLSTVFLSKKSNAEPPDDLEVSEISHSESLIPVLDPSSEVPISEKAVKLVAWPSKDTLVAQRATEDRSDTIQPVYPKKKPKAKPIRLGAISPHKARKEAKAWIERVLKAEWVPRDLENWMIALQRTPASESVIVCRYEINGIQIQVNQSRSVMWVVVSSPSVSEKDNKYGIGSSVFDTFFKEGQRMGAIEGRSTDVAGYMPNPSKPLSPEAAENRVDLSLYVPAKLSRDSAENWWGWQCRYAHGRAVAVCLQKRIAGSARDPHPDDPWF